MACSLLNPYPRPYGAVPSPRQLLWHEVERYCLIHFGINTFTNLEWGYGDESPRLFNPTDFDADQWVRTCVEAGLKGLILVCKHHDGFCLWPTETTSHSVKNSPWRDGKGDLVGEVSAACLRHGLKFGVYLSPWDRNHPEYGREGYVKAYHQQLCELLTGYGQFFEVWFDGANGGDGYYGGARDRRTITAATYYQWDIITKLVREHQPNACMFNHEDIRYVGNELGSAEETCWATYPECTIDTLQDFQPGTGVRHGARWMPAECDFPLRKGWFFHADDPIRQPIKLAELYFQSVGRGCALNIGLAPDQRGRIHADDVQSLRAWNELIRDVFRKDLLEARNTFWSPAPDASPELIFDFYVTVKFNVVELQEQIALGQRVDSFAVDIWKDQAWHELATGTSIGYKRLLMTRQALSSKVRIRITKSSATPILAKVGLYQAPLKMILSGEIRIKRNRDGYVTLSCTNDGLSLRYTTDGSEPDSSSASYEKPFLLKDGGVVKAYAFVQEQGEPRTSTVAQTFGCDRSKWRVVRVSLESPFTNDGAASVHHLLDDDPSTYWHTYHTDKAKSAPPHEVVFDMGEDLKITGFTFLPFEGEPDGTPDKYEFSLSLDGVHWQLAASGEFSNIKVTPGVRNVLLDQPVLARFMRFVAVHVVDNGNYVLVAGLGATLG